MIGWDMSSSLAGVYTTTKIVSVETFKHGWENNMVVNMAGEFSGGYVSWATSSLWTTSNPPT